MSKATKLVNLQDAFLNQARKQHIGVTVFLTNGFQFHGKIKGYDSFVVVLESERKQNLVYKHAISTIVPEENVSLLETSPDTET